jgi:hypothetical protein
MVLSFKNTLRTARARVRMFAVSLAAAAVIVGAYGSYGARAGVRASPPRMRATGGVGGDRFPAGSYLAAGGSLVATFSPDGKFIVKTKDASEVEAEGAYTLDGEQIVLTENAGAGEDNQRCQEPGKYKWSFDGKALLFTKLTDDCEGRARALTSGPCPIIKPDKT